MASKHSVKYSIVPKFFGMLWAVKESYKVCNGYCDRGYSDTLTLHITYEGAERALKRLKD